MFQRFVYLTLSLATCLVFAQVGPLPRKTLSIEVGPDEQDRFPPCWSGNTPRCSNSTIKNFTVLTVNKTINTCFEANLIDVGWAIRSVNLTILAAYCYAGNNMPRQVFFKLQFNDYYFPPDYSIEIDPSSSCSNPREFFINLDVYDWWWFYDYSGSTVNKFYLYTKSQDFYFMVHDEKFVFDLENLDPGLSWTWPFFLVNPWSLKEPFNFQIWGNYLSSTLNYTCLITTQTDKGPTRLLQAVGNLTSIYIDPESTYWSGTCEFSSTNLTFNFPLGQYFNAEVIISPILRHTLNITYIPLKYFIYNQPIITGVYPLAAKPHTIVTIEGDGFISSPTLNILDQFHHQWSPSTFMKGFLKFNLTDLRDVLNNTALCLYVVTNSRDAAPLFCNRTNNLIYYVTPPPVPPPAPASIPTPTPTLTPTHPSNPTPTPTPTTPIPPSISPQPQPSPPPLPSGPIDIINWMNTNWWTYIVLAAICISAIIVLLANTACSSKPTDPSELEKLITDTEPDGSDGIDPRVLIQNKELSFGTIIGRGSFADVYRGEWLKTEVAIKMINQNVKNEKLSFLKETSLMLNLRHPNVVSLMGVVTNPRLCIITEYCCRGDVGELLLDPKVIIEPEHVRKIALDTCRGMTYLHGSNVIHRDLKARNLLIDKDWNIKVADFGLARGLEEKPGTMTACGTPTHAAPEVIRHSYYTKKADIYSFGICLWEMCTRKEPYDNIPGFRVIVAVATKRMRPKIPLEIDPEWASLIRRCWAEDPETRPEFPELVEIFETWKLPTPNKKTPYKEEDMFNKEKLRSSNNSMASSGSSRYQVSGVPSRTPDRWGNIPENLRNSAGTDHRSTAGVSLDSPENSPERSPDGSRSQMTESSSLHRSYPMPPSPRPEWMHSEILPKVTRSVPKKKPGKMEPKLGPNFEKITPLNPKSKSVGNLQLSQYDDFITQYEKNSRNIPQTGNFVKTVSKRSFTENNSANTSTGKFPRMFGEDTSPNSPGMNGTMGVEKNINSEKGKNSCTPPNSDLLSLRTSIDGNMEIDLETEGGTSTIEINLQT